MEIKIDVKKDNVIKSVDENLISDYLHMGWSIVKKEKNRFDDEESKKPFKKSLKD